MASRGWCGWVVVLAVVAVVTVPLTLRAQQDRAPGDDRVVLFFSPDAPPSEKALRAIAALLKHRRDLALDPVLLVADFARLAQEPSREFQNAIKVLRELAGDDFALALYNERGLELARTFGIERLPAVVLVRDRRAHVAYGAARDVESLMRCK